MSTDSVLFVVDGTWHAAWIADALSGTRTGVVPIAGPEDDDGRLDAYVVGRAPDALAKQEQLVLDLCAESALGPDRTAIWGSSVGAEFALAMGLRHPDLFGTVLGASPGGGFLPPPVLPALPRTYLVAGSEEPWFLENAARWAAALKDGGAEVRLERRAGEHGGDFWRTELPLMVEWAFG